ncbi:MAG: phosphate ABC transporter substrate-binding/OmpA family protein [Planctomycetota bacterium]
MSKGKLLAVAIVWLVILATGVVVWKFAFAPVVERTQAEKEAAEARQREEALRRGGSQSVYSRQVTIRLDGFSGYAVLRSDAFEKQLRDRGIRLRLVDDGADYPARLKALARGDADLAVFTIDALVKASAAAGDLPATIVALVDETAGADAVVTYKSAIARVDDLNDPDARFVVTPDSPSETLARVVVSRFQLDRMNADPLIKVKDPAAVVAKYRASRAADKLAYVAWEPYVSQMLKNDRMHVLVDSSRFPSAIVDVLVASDDMIAKNRDTVLDVVRAYFEANTLYRDQAARVKLVLADAAAGGARLTQAEATRLVDGVWWKNARENQAHMKRSAPGGGRRPAGLPHVEDMIDSITAVLLETGAIAADPTGGNPNYLYNDLIWEDLSGFEPGRGGEQVRGVRLPRLSDAQWKSLVEVGAARAPTLVFPRGSARLTGRSQSLLDELASSLQATRFYVIVRGNASRRGDAEANRRLAEQRAKAVEQYLVRSGVDADRIRALGVEPSGSTSVTFVLGEPPY